MANMKKNMMILKLIIVSLTFALGNCIPQQASQNSDDMLQRYSIDFQPIKSNKLNQYHNIEMLDVGKFANVTSDSVAHRKTQGIFFNEDFLQLNQILYNSKIILPTTTYEDTPFPGSSVITENFFCNEVFLRDISHSFEVTTDSQGVSTFTVLIVGLGTECYFDWTYNDGDGRERDSGPAEMKVRETVIRITFDINSESLVTNENEETYPVGMSSNSCFINLKIRDLKFDGGAFAGVMNVFEPFLRRGLSNQVEDGLCDDINGVIDGEFSESLKSISMKLAPYLQPVGEPSKDITNPLSSQVALAGTENAQLVNFYDQSNDGIGNLFNIVFDNVKSLLGDFKDDPGGPNIYNNGMDLGINIFLRSNILDNGGSYIVPTDFIPWIEDSSGSTDDDTKETNKNMFDVQINPTNLKIFGLDSFSMFDVLAVISNQTLQHQLRWENLIVESDFTVEIRSWEITENDDISIVLPKIVEEASIKFGIDKIDTTASTMIAIDEELLGELQIINLLNSSHIVPCLRYVLKDFEFTQLEINIGRFISPRLENFISKGVENLASSLLEAITDLYGDAFQNIIPNYIATTVRELLTEKSNDSSNFICPTFNEVNGDKKTHYVDFRDLLLDKDAALDAGASGDEPYGRLTPKLLDAAKSFLSNPDNDGSPNINKALIQPLTRAQSKITGTFMIVEDENILLNFVFPGLTVLNVSIAQTRLENLDSFGYPLHLLQPSVSNPHVIQNSLMIGSGSKPIQITSRLKISIQGGGIDIYNDFDLRIILKDALMNLDMLAEVDIGAFMGFPLIDINNPFCWLATISAPNSLNKATDHNAAVDNFSLSVNDLSLDTVCKTCSGSGFEQLPLIFATLKEAGTIDTLTAKAMEAIEIIVKGEYGQNQIDEILKSAEKLCPHNPKYTGGDKIMVSLPNIIATNETREFAIFTGILIIQIGLIVTALSENNKIRTTSITDQIILNNNKNIIMTNFISPSTEIGKIIQTLIQTMNSQANQMKETVLNNLPLLDQDGVFTMETNEIYLSIFTLESISIQGL